MTPQLAAALASGRFTLTALFQFDLPSGPRRLLLGSTEAAWGADTFKGHDSTIGHVDSGDEMRENVSGEAPNTSVSIVPADTADRAEIAGAVVQLSRAQIWLAALQLDGSGHVEVVPDPEPVFSGFIDQATINLDRKRKDVDYTLLSDFDYFFEDGEGQRLNGQFHRSMFPLEKGLDNVSAITKKIYWGATPPNGAAGGGSASIYSYGGGGAAPLGDRFAVRVN